MKAHKKRSKVARHPSPKFFIVSVPARFGGIRMIQQTTVLLSGSQLRPMLERAATKKIEGPIAIWAVGSDYNFEIEFAPDELRMLGKLRGLHCLVFADIPPDDRSLASVQRVTQATAQVICPRIDADVAKDACRVLRAQGLPVRARKCVQPRLKDKRHLESRLSASNAAEVLEAYAHLRLPFSVKSVSFMVRSRVCVARWHSSLGVSSAMRWRVAAWVISSS